MSLSACVVGIPVVSRRADSVVWPAGTHRQGSAAAEIAGEGRPIRYGGGPRRGSTSREPTAMSSALDEVAALCAHTLRTGSLLLRGTPAAAGWVLGWMAAEFAPHVLTGHALSALPSPLERAAAGLAFQRADGVLESVLTETFGERYAASVHHPLEPDASRRPHVARVIEAMQHRPSLSWKALLIFFGKHQWFSWVFGLIQPKTYATRSKTRYWLAKWH